MNAWRALEADVRRAVSRRVKSSADADDIVQDVLARVDLQRSPGFVYRTAANAAIDHHRARTRTLKKRVELDEALLVEASPEPEAKRELVQRLIACLPSFLEELSEIDREALRLVYLEDRAQVEAAETLGLSVSGMKSRVQRSRARLRALFDACCAIALDARNAPHSCETKRPCSCSTRSVDDDRARADDATLEG